MNNPVVFAYFNVHYKGNSTKFQMDETMRISDFKCILAGVWANKRPEELVLLHGITELEDNYQFDEYGLMGASCTQANPFGFTLMDRRDWKRFQLLWAQITGSYICQKH